MQQFKKKFTPTYIVEEKPGAPELGMRFYAASKVESISLLGYMVLQTNETVVVNDSINYNELPVSDFDVVFKKNSDMEDTVKMEYEVEELSDSGIKI